MKQFLIALFIIILGLDVNAQTNPGTITTLDGQTLQGEIAQIPDKTLFQGVRFINDKGVEKDYLPNELQAFTVNENYAFLTKYEPIHLDSLGTYFFQNKFQDGALKYLFATIPAKEQGRQGVVELYLVNNKVVLAEADFGPLAWQNPQTDTPVAGGIITANGDTLRGSYTANRNKLEFYNASNNNTTTFDINKLRGFYNDTTAYCSVNIVAPDEKKGHQELCWILVNGPQIQLIARQVDVSTYERVYNNYYNRYNNPYYDPYYYNQSPQYRKVKSGYALMFTIRNPKENKILNFLADYYQAPTRLGNLALLRDWLKDYPALQSAALGNSINSEKALVHLYNLHQQLVQARKN